MGSSPLMVHANVCRRCNEAKPQTVQHVVIGAKKEAV